MILEFDGNFNGIDPITKEIMLDEYYEELLDEGFTTSEARIQVEIIESEIFGNEY